MCPSWWRWRVRGGMRRVKKLGRCEKLDLRIHQAHGIPPGQAPMVAVQNIPRLNRGRVFLALRRRMPKCKHRRACGRTARLGAWTALRHLLTFKKAAPASVRSVLIIDLDGLMKNPFNMTRFMPVSLTCPSNLWGYYRSLTVRNCITIN